MVISHALPKTLSRLRVDYSYLMKAADGGEVVKANFIDGRRYFNAIVGIYGPRSDTDAFLGMTYYYLGDRTAALGYFLKLKEKEPGFFWANYNLALLYYLQKDLTSFEKYAQQAYESSIERSVTYITKSKVYQPLLIENHVSSQDFVRNMESGKMILLKALIATRSGSLLSARDKLFIRVF
ncbi:MAG: hypothetical protein HQL22_09905 [Candidatus Omnitrophica bacterium]|nr:hypothetical protein [Candidatus Omnitrophota bacterium]